MKIIFCSNVHGQTGTTTNMLSAAVLSDILYDKKSILLQTQPKLNQLEVPLIEHKKRKELIKPNKGMDTLIKHIKTGSCSKELFGDSCISLINSSIHFIPGCEVQDMNKFVDSIAKSLHEILSLAEELYEIVFLDAGVMPESISEILYKEADLLVMCLNQNKRVLEDYFTLRQKCERRSLSHSIDSMYGGHTDGSKIERNLSPSLICAPPEAAYGSENEKIVYIIGNYDKYSANSAEVLIKTYKNLNADNTFFIPYNTEVRDAVSESKLFTYFYRNITCDKTDINYEFLQAALRLTRHINK